MAVEPRRGCGYRKVGGLYLVGGRATEACGRLPIPLVVCPTCGGGIKQTRGWTWVQPEELLSDAPACRSRAEDCAACPLADPSRAMRASCDCDGGPGEHAAGCASREPARAGLLWIGASFYKTPAHFMAEARSMGVCRRISALPRGFTLGEHWVLLGHPEACPGDGKRRPGIFSVFLPTAVEKIVTESEARDREAMDKLRERGITPVAVPDDDLDHQGTVYDKEGDE